jgi:hypothetical protein
VSTAVYVVYATRTLDVSWISDDATVIVVHNDDAFDRTSLSRSVIHVDAPGNVGFGAGVNLALPHVTGDRVVLCNPDLVLTPAHWHVLAAGVTEDDVVTVPLIDETGAPTSTCSRYPTPFSQLATGYRLGRWLPRGSRGREVASRALGSWGRAHGESLRSPIGTWPLAERWVSGAALSVDVERFRAVDGFDEKYFLYSEDVDLCIRMARRWRSMRAVVADVPPGVHAVGASAAGDSARVERIRLDSTIRYADAQQGVVWSACSSLLRLRRVVLR